jgi:predicted esterase
LSFVFDAYPVDPERIAVSGFSDGASYALSLGLINGTLFSQVPRLLARIRGARSF